jgi:hypothetical protein
MMNLPVICTLLSSKMEQPISPSFGRMISLLSKEEKMHVTKLSLVQMEEHIIQILNCEFHLPGPIVPLERYLRLLGYH